jgi:hypothetical protein
MIANQSKLPAGIRIASLRMPLGDHGKCQHFGAAEDTVRCEHGDQARESFGYRAQRVLFHSKLPAGKKLNSNSRGHKLTRGQLAALSSAAFLFSSFPKGELRQGAAAARVLDPPSASAPLNHQ